MDDLAVALDESRRLIREALVAARAELAQLDGRRAVLLAQIGEAERALGDERETRQAASSLTLHEAMAQVLRDGGNAWMTARELADAVNARALYRTRDGSPVEVNQIHARTNNYESMFEKEGSRMRLRGEPDLEMPDEVIRFRDDDPGFRAWIDSHDQGFFINTRRSPDPDYLVLHRPGCPYITPNDNRRWTKDYIKVCSDDRPALETWARQAVGGEVTLCGQCFG